MQVKICGITKLEDALFAINHKVDALGFVFYEKSSRYITPQNAKKIIEKLPIFIHKVGLFVNHTPKEINTIMRQAKLSIAQIHKTVSKEFLSQLNHPFVEVIRVQNEKDLLNINKDKYYLVDSYTKNYGGDGVCINLDVFNDINCSKFILAGGLNNDNLGKIKKYNFYGVDVSSGVESSKGIKDTNKIKKFIHIAKNITNSN